MNEWPKRTPTWNEIQADRAVEEKLAELFDFAEKVKNSRIEIMSRIRWDSESIQWLTGEAA